MSQFVSFVKKEFLHIIRDPRTVLILMGIPIVQIVLFGFAITNEVRNARVAVCDQSRDVVSHRMIHKLEASEYFTINYRTVAPADIDRLFRQGKIDAGLVFAPDFDEEILRSGEMKLQIITDASDPNTGQMISNYARMVMLTGEQFATPSGELGHAASSPEILSQLLFNPAMKGSYNFVPGVMSMILLLICAMMTSISIVREKEHGTMEVLLVSPVKPIHIIMAKMVPYFVLSLLNLVSILLLSVFVLEVPVAGNVFQLVLISLVYIVVGLALGLLISTLVSTQITAMLISGMVLMMPVIWFSGMMFPIENMPLPLHYLSGLLPARWYLSAVKKIMIQGLDIRFALREVWVLLLMAFVLIVVSWKKFSNKLG